MTPELFYGLNEGERILIRRALAMYGQHFLAEQRKHVAAKDGYNADMDKARLAAVDALSEKILKKGRRLGDLQGTNPLDQALNEGRGIYRP